MNGRWPLVGKVLAAIVPLLLRLGGARLDQQPQGMAVQGRDIARVAASRCTHLRELIEKPLRLMAQSDKDIVREAKERFERCQAWESQWRDRAKFDQKFANGDSPEYVAVGR